MTHYLGALGADDFEDTPAPSGDIGGATDTARIQAAIDAAATAGGGTVQLRDGTYIVQKLTLKTGVTLRGTGIDSTTVQLAIGQNSNVIETAGFAGLVGNDNTTTPHNFGWGDLTVDGNVTGQATLPTVADGAITSGSAVLTSATAGFTNAAVGKPIRVAGAGASGAALVTTIVGYTNATTVTLAVNAGTTVSAAGVKYGWGIGIAAYGNAFAARNFRVRNCASWGLWTEWATQSTWLAPDGMDSKLSEFMIHDNAEGGYFCAGPHDIQALDFHIVRNGPGAGSGTAQLYAAQSNKANGAIFDFGHIWGGTTDYCVSVSASGITFGRGMQIEGGRVAEVRFENGSNNLYGRLFAGGVNQTTCKGVLFAGSFPGAIVGDVTVENCGGAVADFTSAGGNHDLTLRAKYTSTPAPAVLLPGLAGNVAATSQVRLFTTDTDGSVAYNHQHPSSVTQGRTIQAASGNYLVPAHNSSGTSTSPALGVVYLAPVDVGPARQAFRGLGSNINVAGTGGTTPLVHLGLYKDDGTGGKPLAGGAPLGEVTFDPTTTTGDRVVDFASDLVLQPGRYWLAWMLTSGAALTTSPTVVVLNGLPWFLPRQDLSNTAYKGWQLTASSAAATLPTMGSPSLSTLLPITGLRAR